MTSQPRARRGDLVTVVVQGDFGKPRPALVLQADQFIEHASVTVLPVSGTLVAAPLLRITLEPSLENGRRKPSQVMLDKSMTIKRSKIGRIIGHVGADTLVEVERCMAVFLGIAK